MADITTPTTGPTTVSGTEQAAHTAAAATDQAGNVAAAAKDQAAAVASTAAEEVRAVASEAAGEAKNVLADARQQLRAQANEQSEKVASLVGDIGGQLRTMADAGDAGVTKDIIAGFADQAEQVSQRLSDGGLDRTLEDARRLARNRPGLFLAGAAFAGFVAARVARAANTDSLKQAASPSDGSAGNGHELGPQRDLQSVGATGLSVGGGTAQRPVLADPMPGVEVPR